MAIPAPPGSTMWTPIEFHPEYMPGVQVQTDARVVAGGLLIRSIVRNGMNNYSVSLTWVTGAVISTGVDGISVIN